MEIKELNLADEHTVTAVAHLYCRVFSEPPWNEVWQLSSALEVVQKPALRWWTMRHNHNLIGFTAGAVATADTIAQNFDIPHKLLTGNRIGYLSEVGVNPVYRRSGFARELSNTLLAHFRAANVDQFVVRTRPGTGNFGWYSRQLNNLYTYPDGRVIFGQRGVPTL